MARPARCPAGPGIVEAASPSRIPPRSATGYGGTVRHRNEHVGPRIIDDVISYFSPPTLSLPGRGRRRPGGSPTQRPADGAKQHVHDAAEPAHRAPPAVKVGTFTGTSWICLPRGLAPGGACCAGCQRGLDVPGRSTRRGGPGCRIQLLGPRRPLRSLPANTCLDLAFIDAEKTLRDLCDECAAYRLRRIILLDNTFIHGRIFDRDPGSRRRRGPGLRRAGAGRRLGGAGDALVVTADDRPEERASLPRPDRKLRAQDLTRAPASRPRTTAVGRGSRAVSSGRSESDGRLDRTGVPSRAGRSARPDPGRDLAPGARFPHATG